ncbi:MAG: glycoside hydrolase family 65 protein [Firmicutes bacterium]|nr:glycoside hydrolase family 65 protein [Bacillota bacterium]
MEPYFKVDQWKVIESGFHPEQNRVAESIMSLGNGYLGLRGYFEERYSGDSLQGTYLAGIYYPDRTVVGWWKVGYPEYFAKVLNAVNFIGIDVSLGGLSLDLHTWRPEAFKRVLNMQEGFLARFFTVKDKKGRQFSIKAQRFLSKAQRELAAIRYSITLDKSPCPEEIEIEVGPFLDGNVINEDANYGEDFWIGLRASSSENYQLVTMQTKKSDFVVAAASTFRLSLDGKELKDLPRRYQESHRFAQAQASYPLREGQTLTLDKVVAITTNRDFPNWEVNSRALEILNQIRTKSYEELFQAHRRAWRQTWENSDLRIKGDPLSQQGLRFNIFHLNQTYTGEDPRLNIGPKGFTGEKYGGGTYWDTEAYCLPFYLGTCEPHVARNLLLYRYNHLEKAKENAAKLGLKGALYPMVTVNGEECHNEWEITFEEIHRNGAIAYAIFNYVRYTDDSNYLYEYGLEVLVEISRFWTSRVNFQPRKQKYMLLGVTGPNEYENNVNNNWYTNRIAAWCLEYTLDTLAWVENSNPGRAESLKTGLNLKDEEVTLWREIKDKMYYPYLEAEGVFEQQDGFRDKELITVEQIDQEDLPLSQNWSWDRILRSCFIKQADVLQGLFFFSEEFSLETKKRNFDFYEPMTVHESSLSPSVHAIIAAEIGSREKAYQLFLRAARLDLDNYNNDSGEGLHITSMAGTWMSVVYGFAGMKVCGGKLSLAPFLPRQWQEYSFKLLFRGHRLEITVGKKQVVLYQKGGESCSVVVHGKTQEIGPNQEIKIALPF